MEWRSMDEIKEVELNEDGVIRWVESKEVIHPFAYRRFWCIRYYRPSDKKLVTMYLHRAMAMLFVPNDNNYKFVKFKDGDKTNFKASNLSWVVNAAVKFNTRTNQWENKNIK